MEWLLGLANPLFNDFVPVGISEHNDVNHLCERIRPIIRNGSWILAVRSIAVAEVLIVKAL
jgi:hypothetical protein